MTRKEINTYITGELGNWPKSYSVECHLNVDNWDGQTVSLKEMRKIARPGETWFLDRYSHRKCYRDDMREITIPKI